MKKFIIIIIMKTKCFFLMLGVSIGFYNSINAQTLDSLRCVKVASVYEYPTDMITTTPSRSVPDVIQMLTDTKTDFIFRGWWRYYPCPQSSTDSSYYNSSILLYADSVGYTYTHLCNAVTDIKNALPDIRFCGAIGAQYLQVNKDQNEKTGAIIDSIQTWDMAIDPQKWGMLMSKSTFLFTLSLMNGGYGVNNTWYYPDITNPAFQTLFLSWAKKEIDCGADAIWIDLLYTQASMFNDYAVLYPGQAVSAIQASKDSYDAASLMVDSIHAYGMNTYGKHIDVGTWLYSMVDFPYKKPNLDFVTVTFSTSEISALTFDQNTWNKTVQDVNDSLDSIPIFVFLDWAGSTSSQLGVFSQSLSSAQQKEFIMKADSFLTSKGIIFTYPMHGGNMGGTASVLSFGKYLVYDSKAPEFDTYDTLKALALIKSLLPDYCDSVNYIPEHNNSIGNADVITVYPNPAQGKAQLEFELAEKENVQITLYNVLGEELGTVANCEMSAGTHKLALSNYLSGAGVYIIRVKAGDTVSNRKLINFR